MEYGNRDLIPGENGYEKTAITLKSIAELVAEEKRNMAALERKRPRENSPVQAALPEGTLGSEAPVARLQQPPQFNTEAQHDMPARQVVAPATVEPEQLREAVASRSFFSRLWRKKA